MIPPPTPAWLLFARDAVVCVAAVVSMTAAVAGFCAVFIGSRYDGGGE